MRKLYLLVLLLAVVFPSVGQTRKLDSLYHLLNTHPEQDTIRVKLLQSICYYENKIDPEKSKKLAMESLKISNEISYRRGVGYAHKYIGSYYRGKGDYVQASEHAFKMVEAFEGTSNVRGLGQSYQFLGIINQEIKNLEKAKIYHLKAAEIFERAGLKLDLSFLYGCLGALALDTKEYEDALTYQFKSIELREALHYEDDLLVYANIATTYKLMGKYDKALEYFQKELPRMKASPFKDVSAIAFIELGDLYTITGDFSNAEACLSHAVELTRSTRNKRLLEVAYQKFTHLEKERKNYPAALAYQEQSNLYNDSIFNEDKSKQVAELEVRYESEKKDQAIQALVQQRQIQKLKLWYILGGLLILIIIFIVLYLIQRSHNKKINSLLLIQQSLNAKLQESDQLKSKFFANISHEFRTPLTLIMAPIDEKLSSPKLSAPDKKSFLLIRRNAFRLLHLINQLLDLSKLEAKKMELSIQCGDLRKFFAIVAASFDSLAEHNEIIFQKNIQITSDEAWYDSDKLEKIINNILSNAIKFTPAGGSVTLGIHQISGDEILITISDTGRGITAAEQENIFSPFFQSRYREEEDQPGTGLGLSLVKELVKLYGSTLHFESEVNKGTTMSVTLPVAKEKFPSSAINHGHIQPDIADDYHHSLTPATEDEDGTQILESANPDAILIIEDNHDLREYIAAVLKNEFTVFTAKDGDEGFALATENIPSLIISDVMMPNLNGIALTEKLKSDERTNHIPVVLLTAKADEDSKIEGLVTGADDYLSKPFSTAELKIRISNLIEQRKKLAAKYRAGLSTPLPEEITPQAPSMDEKFLNKVREVVENNIANNGFGVEQLADEIHLSRAQLFRKLKAIVNLSPNEFINEIRLQKAAEMIRLRTDGLTQISYSVGYSEQSYFAKRFRKKFGVTPSEYQAKYGK